MRGCGDRHAYQAPASCAHTRQCGAFTYQYDRRRACALVSLARGTIGWFEISTSTSASSLRCCYFCHGAALVVELDGSQHEPSIDALRTSALERQGFHILRFWDNDVLTDIDAMLEEILRTAQIRTLTRRFAPPSPDERGKKQGSET